MKRWLLVLSLLLSGCAAVPVEAPEPERVSDFDRHLAALDRLEDWSLRGRAAIRTLSDAGTVSLDWRQQGERYTVELRAPLGAGGVRLEGGEYGVLLRTADGEQVLARDAAELLEQHTGYRLPVEALRYWLLGRPVPDAPARSEFNPQGLLGTLEQLGFSIEYRRYGEFAGLALPTLVFMRGEDVELRVVVQGWELGR